MNRLTRLAVTLGIGLTFGGLAAAPAVQCAETRPTAGGVYLGFSPGYCNIKIPGRSFTMEGIDFNDIVAKKGNAAVSFRVGYWISDNVGFEGGLHVLGDVNATFDYFQPPAEQGTGESKISLFGSDLSMQLGQSVGSVHLFARGGVLFWSTDYESNFYPPGGGRQERTLSKSGKSFTYGVGATWNIKDNWFLRLDGSFMKVDVADVKVATLGLEYRWR